jgi:hypothetical protein
MDQFGSQGAKEAPHAGIIAAVGIGPHAVCDCPLTGGGGLGLAEADLMEMLRCKPGIIS